MRRAGVNYKIIGNVRFYERKEIKDALAYLRLIVNPDDDVSLRRVINVPARGLGKVALEAIDAVPMSGFEGSSAGGAGPSLWARIHRGLAEDRFPPRAAASLGAFRDLIGGLTEMAAREPVSVAVGRTLDQTGYLQALREERSEEGQGRIENLAELVSAAREHEGREADASLAGFVDRLSLLSDADEEAGAPEARVFLLTLHSAKGLEFPVVVITGFEEGLCPHARSQEEEAELEEERRLCYVGMTRAESRLVLTGAARRRVFGEYHPARPSRFLDEIPPELIDRVGTPAPKPWQGSFPSLGAQPYRSGGRRGGVSGVREEFEPAHRYEDEDQSRPAYGPGTRVRHARFGVGTVISVEEAGDDVKVTVRFPDIGQKRLLASYAKLEIL
jgi:DNA helicase II / ATP-dependent DNA helicase PcrA